MNKLGQLNGGSNISIDEFLFTHLNREKICIIGAKSNKTTNIRLDLYKRRGEEKVKTFIYNQVKENNNIITDGWLSYNFLDSPNLDYTHEIHVHELHRNFGFGKHSSSHIEGVWVLLNHI